MIPHKRDCSPDENNRERGKKPSDAGAGKTERRIGRRNGGITK